MLDEPPLMVRTGAGIREMKAVRPIPSGVGARLRTSRSSNRVPNAKAMGHPSRLSSSLRFEWTLPDLDVRDLHFLVFLAIGVLFGDGVAGERRGHGLARLAHFVGLLVGLALADQHPAVAVAVDEHDVVAG